MSPASPRPVRRAAFFSDVHLGRDDALTADLLSRFLRQLGTLDLDALYVLGDLFEYWAGDDDLEDPFNARFARELRVLADAGVSLYFLAGNRDLLIGAGFAAAAGLEILPDPARVDVAGTTLLVSHGDALCTDDLAYQNFRRMVREPKWQAEFLAQPRAKRHELIAGMRSASETAKRDKPQSIMDVNAGAVAALMSASGLPMLVHGHTHRPAQHRIMVDGRGVERWVLPDWDAHSNPVRGGGLLYDAKGMSVVGSDGRPR